LVTWMTSVTTAVNGLVPGAVAPFAGSSIGTVAKGSSKVTIG